MIPGNIEDKMLFSSISSVQVQAIQPKGMISDCWGLWVYILIGSRTWSK